jgi:hypothetical protein
MKCPDCGVDVAAADNSVYLDVPAVEWDGGRAQWTLMQFGGMVMATAGDPSPDGMAHTLHEHQPEGVLA